METHTSLELTLTTRSPVTARPTVAPTPTDARQASNGVTKISGPLAHRLARDVWLTLQPDHHISILEGRRQRGVDERQDRDGQQTAGGGHQQRRAQAAGEPLHAAAVARAEPRHGPSFRGRLWLPAGEEQTAQRWPDRDPDDQGGDDRNGVRQDHRRKERSGPSFQHRHGKNGEHGNDAGIDQWSMDCRKSLLNSDPGGLSVRARTPGSKPLDNGVPGGNRLIHHDGDRGGETSNHECVESVAEQIDDQGRGDHRQRHSDHADERCAPVKAHCGKCQQQ